MLVLSDSCLSAAESRKLCRQRTFYSRNPWFDSFS
ncbi:hypothetical protein YSA_00276 [Pseudomonas putida ND6]|uniref:Uncharacterized protein n=1 Tax=Pseudomonas putida ND6 TaxID=231023 RepID=I3UN51_PSEPU|nr:hypothetical protein YSA_00276 [Pseudomonas putida ND6]